MSDQPPKPVKGTDKKEDFPWWLAAVALIGVYLGWQVVADDLYLNILKTLSKGVQLTIFVTLVSFFLASLLGLGLALAAGSRWLVIRQSARFYIEVVRGIPIIVLLLYVAFVLAPALVELRNWIGAQFGLDPIRTRNFPLLWRAIIALSLPAMALNIAIPLSDSVITAMLGRQNGHGNLATFAAGASFFGLATLVRRRRRRLCFRLH